MVGVYLFHSVASLHFFLFFFLGGHLWPMEVPRLEVKLELLAYTTATATWARAMFATYIIAHGNALTH